jgi:hypothetical protein
MKRIEQIAAFSIVLLFSQSLLSQSPSETEPAQPTTKKSHYVFNTALSKGTTHVSYYSSLGGMYSTPPNSYLLEFTFNPKVNFFICDNFNVGIGYLGMKSKSSDMPQINSYSHNIEAELSYFFFSRAHSFFSVQVGYIYGQARLSVMQTFPGTLKRFPGSALKLGATATRRLKWNESFGVTFNPSLVFDVERTPTSFFDSFYALGSFGLNYFFVPSSKKAP